jgi:VWFA-related protein
MRVSRFSLRVIVVSLVVSAVSGAPRAQQPPPPTFRAGTDLVEVDVVVHDKSGKFVSDLSTDDFIIEEAGRPQPIEQFYLHVTDASGWAPLAPPSLAADATPIRSTSRVFLAVFDDAHLTPAGFKRTQAAALTFFSQQFRPGDIGGVVTGGRLVKDRFTSDREELLKAIKDAKPNAAKSSRMIDERLFPRMSEIEAVLIEADQDRDVLGAVTRRACADEPEWCQQGSDPEVPVRAKASQLAATARAESARTLQVLRVLTVGLSRFEGRKTIVLMSEGFIAEDSWPLVQDLVTATTRVNARVYTLDARGGDRGLTSIFDRVAADTGTRLLEQMDFGADAMNSLSVDTGGFVVRNTNQFDRAMARIADDVNNYYVLAYRPAAPPDGKFHRISVKVKRPGVAVRARRGYVAMPKPSELTTAVTPSPAAVEPARPTEAAAARETPPIAREAPPPAVAAEPDPSTIGARVVPSAENTSGGIRVRPDAEAHAMRLGPNAVDADASAGWDAYQRGDVETARAKLGIAAARPNAQSWVHYTLGMSTYALGQFRDAAASWERVRSMEEAFEPVYFDLIDAYLQLKEQDRALRTARTALERWPQDAELFEALGVVQTVRGSIDDAIKSFQAAVAIAPADPTGYFNLAKAMEMRYFRSRRYVSQLRKWVANDADRQTAIEHYERYLALNGPYADAARAGLTRLNWVPK